MTWNPPRFPTDQITAGLYEHGKGVAPLLCEGRNTSPDKTCETLKLHDDHPWCQEWNANGFQCGTKPKGNGCQAVYKCTPPAPATSPKESDLTYLTNKVAILLKGPMDVGPVQQVKACYNASFVPRPSIDPNNTDAPYSQKNTMVLGTPLGPQYYRYDGTDTEDCTASKPCGKEVAQEAAESASGEEAGKYNSLAYNCMKGRKFVPATLKDAAWKAGKAITPDGSEGSYFTMEHLKKDDYNVCSGYKCAFQYGLTYLSDNNAGTWPSSSTDRNYSQPFRKNVTSSYDKDPYDSVGPNRILDFASQTLLRKNLSRSELGGDPSASKDDWSKDSGPDSSSDMGWGTPFDPDTTCQKIETPRSIGLGCGGSNRSRFRYLSAQKGFVTGRDGKIDKRSKPKVQLQDRVLVWADYLPDEYTGNPPDQDDRPKATPWPTDYTPPTQEQLWKSASSQFQFYSTTDKNNNSYLQIKTIIDGNPYFVGVYIDESKGGSIKADGEKRPVTADLQLFNTVDLSHDLDNGKRHIHTNFGFKQTSSGRAVLGLVGVLVWVGLHESEHLEFKGPDDADFVPKTKQGLDHFFSEDYILPMTWRLSEYSATEIDTSPDSAAQGLRYQVPIACVKMPLGGGTSGLYALLHPDENTTAYYDWKFKALERGNLGGARGYGSLPAQMDDDPLNKQYGGDYMSQHGQCDTGDEECEEDMNTVQWFCVAPAPESEDGA